MPGVRRPCHRPSARCRAAVARREVTAGSTRSPQYTRGGRLGTVEDMRGGPDSAALVESNDHLQMSELQASSQKRIALRFGAFCPLGRTRWADSFSTMKQALARRLSIPETIWCRLMIAFDSYIAALQQSRHLAAPHRLSLSLDEMSVGAQERTGPLLFNTKNENVRREPDVAKRTRTQGRYL